MPFGGYKNFDSCVKANSDKDDPKGYCATIMRQVEGKDGKPTGIYKWIENPTLQKLYKDSNKKYHLASYISSTRRDRDGDRFDRTVLQAWADKINLGKTNLGTDHGHSWEDSIGVFKHAELRHNPHDGVDYLFADAVLEDPDINPKVKLLTHKAEIGEQLSLSISANPGETKWYDMETDKEGRNTRVIKNAELLQADIVAQPANVDARAIDIVLKHLKETGCGEDCIVCQFDSCVNKSMIAPNTKIEQSVSSLVTEKESKPIMTDTVKKSQEELNKEHGCKEGEKYCDKEGKCMPDEPVKSQLSPEVEKFIETIKAVATNDPNGTQVGGLESIVQQALASMRAVPAQGQFKPAIPAAQISVTPGTSGQSGVQPQTTSSPTTPNLATGLPIPQGQIPVSPGQSGTSGVQPQAGTTPTTPEIANPAPIPVAQVQASVKDPEIKKEYIKTVLVDRKKFEDIMKAREKVTPKQENAGEILPTVIDTAKLEPELRKAAEEYNKKVYEIHASQVKQQYTPNDLVKMSAEGKLVKDLDQNNNFDKTVKVIAKSKNTQKIAGTLLLQKAA